MFGAENSQRIAKYILLSFLCFDSTFSATTESALRPEDDEDVSINGDDEDILLRLDFFRFTTRKRYIWEDWTVPTRDPVDYGEESTPSVFLYYVLIPIVVCIFVISFVYICCKLLTENDCCSAESDSHSSISADTSVVVHPPPQRRTYQSTQVHMPPTGGNQFSDSRREMFSEPAMRHLFSEIDSNRGTAHAAGATISFVNSTYASATQNRREPDNTVAEKLPDYSTVTLSDLVNPTKPAFPVVKTENETPPPEYGKENPFFK